VVIALVADGISGGSNARRADHSRGASGRYEVTERLAADFVPTIMARGFHAGPVFSIFGAAVAVAKIMGLDAEQVHGALA
jgi:hypothetical protein